MEALEEKERKARAEALRSDLERRGLGESADAIEAAQQTLEWFKRLSEGFAESKAYGELLSLIKLGEKTAIVAGEINKLTERLEYYSGDLADLKEEAGQLQAVVVRLTDEVHKLVVDAQNRWVREKETLDLIDDYIKRNM